MKRFILILFLLLAAREIRAFGLAGHAAIACIAEHHLTPRARANIMRYTDHRSIVYYASWMDEWRRSKGYEFTTHWHAGTVDAEFRSTPAVREASGAKGDCVVAVEQSIALLSEYDKLDDSTVLVHIKYLVHLLGDMHCPTHVYYYPDNMTLGKFPVKLHGVETNYHKIWDGQLLDSRHKFWGFQDYRHALDNYTDEEIARMTEGTPSNGSRSRRGAAARFTTGCSRRRAGAGVLQCARPVRGVSARAVGVSAGQGAQRTVRPVGSNDAYEERRAVRQLSSLHRSLVSFQILFGSCLYLNMTANTIATTSENPANRYHESGHP